MFLALHFLDLMCLTGCEYRMELAGLLGVMGWEITVPLIRVGTLQAPSLLPRSPALWPRLPVWLCIPGALHIPWESACRLVSTPGTHLTRLAVAAASPCDQPEARRAAKASLLRARPPPRRIICVRSPCSWHPGYSGNLWTSSFLRLVQSEVPNTPRCQGMRGQVLQGEPGEGTHYHTLVLKRWQEKCWRLKLRRENRRNSVPHGTSLVV